MTTYLQPLIQGLTGKNAPLIASLFNGLIQHGGLTADQREQLQTSLRALLVSLTRDEKRNTSDTNALP